MEDIGFLERFLKVRDELPALERARRRAPTPTVSPARDIITYDALLDHEPVDLAEAAAARRPGRPGHDHLHLGHDRAAQGRDDHPLQRGLHRSRASIRSIGKPKEELAGFRLVSYLPMAHIAERITSHYAGMRVAYEITCCPDLAQLGEYLREVRPNLLFGVPRVWEKIYAGVTGRAGRRSGEEAEVRRGHRGGQARSPWPARGTRPPTSRTSMWDFLQAVAFGPVRELVGLDQVEFAITGAAPIPAMLIEWFNALGVPLSEVYGLSETTGSDDMDRAPDQAGLGRSGDPGCEVTLADDGEIICRGGNVFAGLPRRSRARRPRRIDADGWFHSGDIGRIDDDGYVRSSTARRS